MIRGVYFDLDNTLIQLAPRQTAALAQIYDELRGYLPADVTRENFIQTRQTVSGSQWDTLARGGTWTYYDYLLVTLQQTLAALHVPWVPADSLARVVQAFQASMLVADADPDALELLQHLSQEGYLLGIITNGPPGQSQYLKLESAGLMPFVAGRIYNSGDLGMLKPDPAIYNLALPAGVKPAEMLFVGDNLHTDIAGAQAAGWRSIWFNPEGRERPTDTPLPSLTIHRLLDLLPWLATRAS